MKFITYNDSPGGVYNSQVIDVCRFLQNTFSIKVHLVSFVSFRSFIKERKKIKDLYANSTVLPSFPGIENWRKNLFSLRLYMLFHKPDKVIGRGVFATLLALKCKRISTVVFDARGAYKAEWKEYLNKESSLIASEMELLEKEALFKSNFRIAVSQQLVEYWRENFGYSENKHVVIPCTFGSSNAFNGKNSHDLRKQWGVKDTEVLLVFSGSSAGWQSMSGLFNILHTAFEANGSLKLLLLTIDNSESEFSKAFPGRVIRQKVEQDKVSTYLKAADYGLLYREDTITNRVSSPVKFAEYLNACLPVIISENVGDYSEFVKENNCGTLFNVVNWESMKRLTDQQKFRIQQLSLTCFSKAAYIEQYRKLV